MNISRKYLRALSAAQREWMSVHHYTTVTGPADETICGILIVHASAALFFEFALDAA